MNNLRTTFYGTEIENFIITGGEPWIIMVGFVKKVECNFVPKGQNSEIYTSIGKKKKCFRGNMMGSRESKGENEYESLRESWGNGVLIRVHFEKSWEIKLNRQNRKSYKPHRGT